MQLDISMQEEYTKATKILESTEQMWDNLNTDGKFKPVQTQDQATSRGGRPQDETLEEQIIRETLGPSDIQGDAARPPAKGTRTDMPMDLYDRMDALLGSISDGSFSSPSSTREPPSPDESSAQLPPLRAPSRPQQPQPEGPATPATARVGPPPALAGRPEINAATARAEAEDKAFSAAELERLAVELEEELFQGGVGNTDLAEAEAASLVRERLQALRQGEADVGGGSGTRGDDLEDRFPDLSADDVTMASLLTDDTQLRCDPLACSLSGFRGITPPPPTHSAGLLERPFVAAASQWFCRPTSRPGVDVLLGRG